MNKRLLAVVTASKLNEANKIARKHYDPKSDTFQVGLAPDGANKPTHYWASTLMPQSTFATMVAELGKLSGTKIYDGDLTHPSEVLSELKLTRFSEAESADESTPANEKEAGK